MALSFYLSIFSAFFFYTNYLTTPTCHSISPTFYFLISPLPRTHTCFLCPCLYLSVCLSLSLPVFLYLSLSLSLSYLSYPAGSRRTEKSNQNEDGYSWQRAQVLGLLSTFVHDRVDHHAYHDDIHCPDETMTRSFMYGDLAVVAMEKQTNRIKIETILHRNE